MNLLSEVQTSETTTPVPKSCDVVFACLNFGKATDFTVIMMSTYLVTYAR